MDLKQKRFAGTWFGFMSYLPEYRFLSPHHTHTNNLLSWSDMIMRSIDEKKKKATLFMAHLT